MIDVTVPPWSPERMRPVAALGSFLLFLSGCAPGDAGGSDVPLAGGEALSEAADYCALPGVSAEVLIERPSVDEEPIDDVNWFARPVPHDGPDRIVAFASHNQNYIYNLTTGSRVAIPDRSDAVATPDGRYMTVPSTYTPDSTVRFYPVEPMLERLERGEPADDIEPVFVHRHGNMRGVYYQSTGIVAQEAMADGMVTTYRLMFSGGADESGFRIVDYRFTHEQTSGDLIGVRPSEPMALCPAVTNDLNTPFISKDGRYVAAYTSESAERGYSPGASLKVFRIVSTNPSAGTTACEPVLDFGFAAGKADFSFDGSMLTFHISQGGYLTPFVNGGLPAGTITDVVVAQLLRDADGAIRGMAGLQRLTTSVVAGVGSYFPAFFPDGSLFYIANSVPRESEQVKRFQFSVVNPAVGPWRSNVFATEESQEQWRTVTGLWERACIADAPALGGPPFPHQSHEAPWLGLSLTAAQCRGVIRDARTAADGEAGSVDHKDWEALTSVCEALVR